MATSSETGGEILQFGRIREYGFHIRWVNEIGKPADLSLCGNHELMKKICSVVGDELKIPDGDMSVMNVRMSSEMIELLFPKLIEIAPTSLHILIGSTERSPVTLPIGTMVVKFSQKLQVMAQIGVVKSHVEIYGPMAVIYRMMGFLGVDLEQLKDPGSPVSKFVPKENLGSWIKILLDISKQPILIGHGSSAVPRSFSNMSQGSASPDTDGNGNGHWVDTILKDVIMAGGIALPVMQAYPIKSAVFFLLVFIIFVIGQMFRKNNCVPLNIHSIKKLVFWLLIIVAFWVIKPNLS